MLKKKRRPTQLLHIKNKKFNITFLPEGKSVPAELNKSILDLAFDNDIVMEHICGGTGACTSCLILIQNGMKYFNKISEIELYQIKKTVLSGPNARLGCLCKLTSEPNENIIIEIPEHTDSD